MSIILAIALVVALYYGARCRRRVTDFTKAAHEAEDAILEAMAELDTYVAFVTEAIEQAKTENDRENPNE